MSMKELENIIYADRLADMVNGYLSCELVNKVEDYSKEKDNEIEKLKEDIKDLEKQVEKLENSVKDKDEEIKDLQEKLKDCEETIEYLENESSLLRDNLKGDPGLIL